MVFNCSKQGKHVFVKYVKYAWKPWKSGVFFINFRGVGIEDSVKHVRGSFFRNSTEKR